MTAMNSRELDSFIGELVRFYGVERAIYVLSRTIQFSDWDSRFDQAVLDRAGQTDFPDARTPRDENHVDPTTRYVTEIDPCVANAIFMKLMELEEEQEATAQMENDGQKELDEDIACQDDKSLKSTLTPIIGKLSDMRIVAAELDYLMYEPFKEFITMAFLLVGNIPLLYFLNKDWYNVLVNTGFGKGILAVCLLVLLISFAAVIRLTKPVEYKR